MSPRNNDLSGHSGGREGLCSSGEVVEEVECGECEANGSEDEETSGADEVRVHRLPHNPGRPTKKDIGEHNVTHSPFRSWCRHCVAGRAVSSPHRSRTEADREFARRSSADH